MGTRENKIETYLKDEIKAIGGITRKWVSPGRDGVPDQIIFLDGYIFFVEVKTSDDGRLSTAQIREHDRLREAGVLVCTVYGHKGVDMFVGDIKHFNIPLVKFYGN